MIAPPKKIINSASTVVPDFIEGLLLSDSRLGRIEGLQALVCRAHLQPTYKYVRIISGGGSGHEPAHAGFIGDGMLTAAILGNVFASPSVATILATLRVCACPAGILLIVKNYTGDRINFGMAVERARAEGILVRMLVVDDDCALAKDKGITGGRGIAGTILVHKVAGAAASYTASLEDVYQIAMEAVQRISTMGVALTVCTVPGGNTSTRLDGNKMEVGLGIHGEQGREQVPFPAENAASAIASILVDAVVSHRGVANEQELALLINNLGATPAIEMHIITKEIVNQMTMRGLKVVRLYVGAFMTALDMAGVSLSLLPLTADLLDLLDAPTTASHWTPSRMNADITLQQQMIAYDAAAQETRVSGGTASETALLVLHSICSRLIEIEPLLTQYDQICGDGDCGLVMKAGAQRILADLASSEAYKAIRSSSTVHGVTDTATLCALIADSISQSMGGTSGGLLELMMRAMATSLAAREDWKVALTKGVEAIQFYGGASRGMRTMLDAFLPAVEALRDGDMVDAAAAAKAGADSTAQMDSLAGRSNYLNAECIRGTPDPGAAAVAAAFDAALFLVA